MGRWGARRYSCPTVPASVASEPLRTSGVFVSCCRASIAVMDEFALHQPHERVAYVGAFLRAAWGGVSMMFTQPPCAIESFSADGTDTVHVTTVGQYLGQRWRFRRQIWPPAHPAMLAAPLYTTSLEERLNTKRLRSSDDVIDL